MEARRGSLLIAGPVTWDVVDGRRLPGGAVSYAARTAAAFGVRARILVLAGPDADLAALEGHEVHLVESPRTLTLRHEFVEGRRRQYLEAGAGRALRPDDLPEGWADAELVLLGPLTPDDLDARAFTALPAHEIALLAQGLQRQAGPRGAICDAPGASAALHAAVTAHTSVFLSREETARWPEGDIEALAAQARRVVLTDGARGATVTEGAASIEVTAVPATPIDTTGAGDVFAAALILALDRGDDIEAAGRLAARYAAAAVERVGPAPLPALDELLRETGEAERATEGGAA